MATRTQNETTSSGGSATRGICGTTRSTSQPTPHLVSYTTANNVKIAILSNSPDQQQYQDPAAAWRRIFKHTDSGHAGSDARSTVAHKLKTARNTQSRKRRRPMGTKIHPANLKQSGESRQGEWKLPQWKGRVIHYLRLTVMLTISIPILILMLMLLLIL